MNHLQNYLNNLPDGNGYESFGGKQPAMINNPAGNPIQKNALQPAAQFTVRISRLTADIVGQALPVAVFGWNKYFSQYIQNLSDARLIGAGTTYDGVVGGPSQAALPTTALADRLQYQFTNGANTDLLQVESDENPYTELLAATGFTPMLVNKIRMSISDQTQNAQFNLGIQVIRSSTFGKIETQTIVPSTQKSPMQFQDGIVDLIDYPIVLDAQSYLVVPILDVANFAVALSFEVQSFSRPLQA